MNHLEPFRAIPNDLIATTIDRWIKGARNREIMKDRLIDVMTYETIAEKYDLSPRYVKALIYRLENEVYDRL